MPLIYLDTFLIRKGNGVFNIHDFIQAFLQANSVDNGYALLENSHHDLNHEDFSGVEADAVKLAVERGLVSEDIANIINGGPDPQKPQRWKFAFQQAINAGAEHINEAIRRTNQQRMLESQASGNRYNEIPVAFTKDLRNFVLNPVWKHGNAKTRSQTGGDFFDEQGRLVTQWVSKNTMQPESYTRPYHVGLDQIRNERGGPQKGSRKRTSDEIRPGLLHTDTIYIKDPRMRFKLGQAVLDVKENNPNMPIEQLHQLALESLKGHGEFGIAGGIRHTGGISYGRYSDEALTQYAAEQIDQVGEMAEDPTIDYKQFVHPDLRDSSFMRYDSHSRYHGKNAENPMPGDRKTIQGLKDKHGWDDETVQRVFADAHSGNYKGSKQERVLAAIHNQEMIDGKPPTWVDQNAIIPKGSQVTPPQQKREKQPAQQPAQLPTVDERRITPRRGSESTGDNNQTALSRAKQLRSQDSSSDPLGGTGTEVVAPSAPREPLAPSPSIEPTAVGAPTTQLNQAQRQPPMLNTYPSRNIPQPVSGRRGFMSNMLNRLGYGFESLFPNFAKSSDQDDLSAVKEMLENVQLEIAKQELQVIEKYSISSPTDIAMFSSTIGRPPSDVITVVHSRGDWKKLAKTFGMAHSDIQKIKVMFDE